MRQVVNGCGSVHALLYRDDYSVLLYLIVCQFVQGALFKLEMCCTLADAVLTWSVLYMTWVLVLAQVEEHV